MSENISELGQEFGQYVIELTAESLTKTKRPQSLSEMERESRQMLVKLGQFLLSSWLALQEDTYPAETRVCPHCNAELSASGPTGSGTRVLGRWSGVGLELGGRTLPRSDTNCGLVPCYRVHHASGKRSICQDQRQTWIRQVRTDLWEGNIVTQRLKVSGAIWDLDNCIKTAKARSALLSNQWATTAARREHLPLTA